VIAGQQTPTGSKYSHYFIIKLFCIKGAYVFVDEVSESNFLEFFQTEIPTFVVGIGTVDFLIT
jgi:hypothetical protein